MVAIVVCFCVVFVVRAQSLGYNWPANEGLYYGKETRSQMHRYLL